MIYLVWKIELFSCGMSASTSLQPYLLNIFCFTLAQPLARSDPLNPAVDSARRPKRGSLFGAPIFRSIFLLSAASGSPM